MWVLNKYQKLVHLSAYEIYTFNKNGVSAGVVSLYWKHVLCLSQSGGRLEPILKDLIDPSI